MEVFKKHIKVKEHEPIVPYYMGDIHEGSASVDHAGLRDAVERIRVESLERQVFVFLTGDLIDAIIAQGDPRFSPAEVDPNYRIKDLSNLPKLQAQNMYSYLKPIAHLVIGCLIGNHEEEYIKRHAYNIYEEAYGEYFPNAALLGYVGAFRLVCHLEKSDSCMNIDFALNHGPRTGGGFREGYPINKVHDLFRWWEADFKIMGHIHRLAADRKVRVSINQKGDGIDIQESWWGVSGSFMLKHKVGVRNYFENQVGPLGDIGMLRSTITFSRQQIDNVRRWKKHLHLEPVFVR